MTNPVTVGARKAVVQIFKFMLPLSIGGTVLIMGASAYGGHYELRTLVGIAVFWPIISMLAPLSVPLLVLGVSSLFDLVERVL